jgi:hypothetical protein
MLIQPRKIALKDLLDEIHTTAQQAAAAAPEQAGACLRTNPQTGSTDCVFTDPITCKSIGGVFLGGPCGT